MNSAPAQTRHSLLASATIAPRSTAASVGRKPAAPVIAAITQSAGRCAASTSALLAGRRLDARCRPARPSVRDRRPGPRPRRSARRARARAPQAPAALLLRGHRLDAIARRARAEQVDGAGADRAGRAEKRDAALAVDGTVAPVSSPILATIGSPHQQARARALQTAARKPDERRQASSRDTNPSSRSITPPWPGIR